MDWTGGLGQVQSMMSPVLGILALGVTVMLAAAVAGLLIRGLSGSREDDD